MKRINWQVARGALIPAIGILLGLGAGAAERAAISEEDVDSAPPSAWNGTPTVAATREGLAAAWCAGSGPGEVDTGIWFARRGKGGWTVDGEIANGLNKWGDARTPCSDPVLFTDFLGKLYLFYHVGRRPSEIRAYLRVSPTAGRGWLQERRLPAGALGATRNPPLFLGDGTLVCAAETRSAGRRVRVEWADKSLKFWERTGPLNRAFVMPCLSPVVLQPAIDAFAMLAVAPEPYNRLVLIRAKKGFRKWDRPRRLALAVEGTPIAAVRLRDRRFLLAYNPEGKRNVIRLAVSEDLEHWTPAGEAASAPQGELLEPALAQDSDEKVHLLFNWNGKKIRHVVLDPEKIQPAASRGRGNASARR